MHIFSIIQGLPDPPVIKFEKISNIPLFRMCVILFKFASISRRITINCDAKSRLYCLKRMQEEYFSAELRFLKEAKEDPFSSDSPPDLVNRLNLFWDDNMLIRSKGRLARSNHYYFDVVNPILCKNQ